MYLENTIMLPIKPVNRVERISKQDKKRERSRQDRPTFAAMLEAMASVEDPEAATQFDFLA